MLTDEDRLSIRRHQVRYRVARGSTRVAALGAQEGALHTSLGERLSAYFPSGDETIWLIRRLHVRASVGSSSSTRGVTKTLAAAVVAALARTFEEGVDEDNVKRFPDRAAFIARLLLDCAGDRAARRWEYREFGEITDRPASTAIRTIVASEAETAVDALIRMTRADLRAVLASLSPADAGAVLESLATAPGTSRADPAEVVAAALGDLLARSEFPTEPGGAALALFLEVARSSGGRPPGRTDTRAREVAQLAATLRVARRDESQGLARALAEGDWRAVDAHALEGLAGLAAWPSDIRRRIVRSLSKALSGEPEQTHRTARTTTDLGGMFLLLPLLDEFPWATAAATWPAHDATEPSRLLQYLTLIAALGPERNAAAAGDPVLRLALGIPEDVNARSLHRWAQGVGADEACRSIQVIAGHLHRLGKVSGAVTLAPLGDGVVAVDGLRGIWLGTAPGEPSSIRKLVASIDAAIRGPVAVAASEAWIEACLEPGHRHPGPIDERFLSRLDEQARHATVGGAFELPPLVRDMLLVTAQGLGRELAWRLPGFSTSTLPYLWDNFLSFAAEISSEPQQIVVHLGDPPLHLVLSLAGLNRRRFRLDATGDREWVLTQQR
jgi:hypothetical protein